MSTHVFHEVYLHINWHVKYDRPILIPRLESIVHKFLTDRCRQTAGVYLHGINGTATQIHMAVNIEPSVCISDMVGDLKGACAREVNLRERHKRLEWQRGFGVVSFGKRQLPWVLKYIANQKQHHARGTMQDRLERTTLDDDGRPLKSVAQADAISAIREGLASMRRGEGKPVEEVLDRVRRKFTMPRRK